MFILNLTLSAFWLVYGYHSMNTGDTGMAFLSGCFLASSLGSAALCYAADRVMKDMK